jgi:hypothetical protein
MGSSGSLVPAEVNVWCHSAPTVAPAGTVIISVGYGVTRGLGPPLQITSYGLEVKLGYRSNVSLAHTLEVTSVIGPS